MVTLVEALAASAPQHVRVAVPVQRGASRLGLTNSPLVDGAPGSLSEVGIDDTIVDTTNFLSKWPDESRFETTKMANEQSGDHLTVRKVLAESYANLAMAHMAVEQQAKKYGRRHFMVRAKLRKGFRDGSMAIRSMADDEKLKMILPQACSYCGASDNLSGDHLVPTSRGGPNLGENLVWACRSCNSSKGPRDMLNWWFATRQEFPPILLLRRYLKMAWNLSEAASMLDESSAAATGLPFDINEIPTKYPAPPELCLWVIPIK